MKTVTELSRPEYANAADELGVTIADAAMQICAERGFDRQCAGLMAMRAAISLLLLDARAPVVSAWLKAMEEAGVQLPPFGGNA